MQSTLSLNEPRCRCALFIASTHSPQVLNEFLITNAKIQAPQTNGEVLTKRAHWGIYPEIIAFVRILCGLHFLSSTYVLAKIFLVHEAN
jgi:hypothetical protein